MSVKFARNTSGDGTKQMELIAEKTTRRTKCPNNRSSLVRAPAARRATFSDLSDEMHAFCSRSDAECCSPKLWLAFIGTGDVIVDPVLGWLLEKETPFPASSPFRLTLLQSVTIKWNALISACKSPESIFPKKTNRMGVRLNARCSSLHCRDRHKIEKN